MRAAKAQVSGYNGGGGRARCERPGRGRPYVEDRRCERYAVNGPTWRRRCVTCRKSFSWPEGSNDKRCPKCLADKLGLPEGANLSVSRLGKYRLSAGQFAAMAKAQKMVCAICRQAPPKGAGSLHVDHNHATGAVRGLLCGYCNRGLGEFRDNPVLLKLASEYLTRTGDYSKFSADRQARRSGL